MPLSESVAVTVTMDVPTAEFSDRENELPAGTNVPNAGVPSLTGRI